MPLETGLFVSEACALDGRNIPEFAIPCADPSVNNDIIKDDDESTDFKYRLREV